MNANHCAPLKGMAKELETLWPLQPGSKTCGPVIFKWVWTTSALWGNARGLGAYLEPEAGLVTFLIAVDKYLTKSSLGEGSLRQSFCPRGQKNTAGESMAMRRRGPCWCSEAEKLECQYCSESFPQGSSLECVDTPRRVNALGVSFSKQTDSCYLRAPFIAEEVGRAVARVKTAYRLGGNLCSPCIW